MAALQSLTATYTDSEGEEEHQERKDSKQDFSKSPSESSDSMSPPRSNLPIKTNSKTLSRLVSYGHDDVVLSDDENDISEEPSKTSIEDLSINEPNDDEDDVLLPPEPPGRCSKELQDKIVKYLDYMKTRKVDMNKMIQSRKDFRNPSIYEKLIQFCGINELGTNYPPSLYDPGKWGKESYYDELLKAQMAEVEKRDKEKKAKVEFVSGTAKRPASSALPSNDDAKRKSKWDQTTIITGTKVSSNSVSSLIRQTSISSLTTSVTGTKGVVLSAFGSLPKKPKL